MVDRAEHIVKLTSVRNEMEAGVIVATLEEHGIASVMTGTYTAGFRAEAPGWVQINVTEKDRDRAQHVLDQVANDQSEIDWSQVDVGEKDDSDADGGKSSFAVWRRIVQILVVVYFIWLASRIVSSVFFRWFS